MKMYEEHPCFETPTDESTTIWRYMNLAKFESLLNREALFFAKSKLFEDPLEGFYSNANLIEMYSLLEKHDENSIIAHNIRHYLEWSKCEKERNVLNCWHMAEYESAAMWKLYSKDGSGISIRSSIGRLKACFSQCQHSVHIGIVKYIDWNKDKIPYENVFWPYSYKRTSFDYEREIRALVDIAIENEKGAFYLGKDRNSHKFESFVKDGIYVSVDLDTLIEKIFVSPKSPKCFLDLVKSVSRKYTPDKEVIQSDLYDGPLY